MIDFATYHGLTTKEAARLRWPGSEGRIPFEAFKNGDYAAFRCDWFIAQGAHFYTAYGAKGKRPWFVRADYIGGSGDFNLNDSRGRLRTFATSEKAKAEADKLNAQAAAFRVSLDDAIAEARPAFTTAMRTHRRRGYYTVKMLAAARRLEAGDLNAAWGGMEYSIPGTVMQANFRAGVRLRAAVIEAQRVAAKHELARLYDLEAMEIGDSFMLPPDSPALNTKDLKPRKFTVRRVDGGARVWRTE